MVRPRLEPIDACVFDAYGTLFDVNSAAAKCRDQLGDQADALSVTWRLKQLQYTWLRSLMGLHADFLQVTSEALSFALDKHSLSEAALHERLMDIYRELAPYPEVPTVLADLKAAGFRTAILSNGTPGMLQSATAAAGIGKLIDQILSIEDVAIYKPDPRVYRLAVDRLGLPARRICFLSANGWDVAGAAHFGFRVIWINRSGEPPDRLPGAPEAEVADLGDLTRMVARS
jgi:2-haloacid dehalogenase